jgi:hypothetical protein
VWALIKSFVENDEKMVLGFQQQMVKEKRTLDETDAGMEVHSIIEKKLKEIVRQMEMNARDIQQAMEQRDSEALQALNEVKFTYKMQLENLKRSNEQLKIDMEKLHAERYRKLEKQMRDGQRRHELEVLYLKHKLKGRESSRYRSSDRVERDDDDDKWSTTATTHHG